MRERWELRIWNNDYAPEPELFARGRMMGITTQLKLDGDDPVLARLIAQHRARKSAGQFGLISQAIVTRRYSVDECLMPLGPRTSRALQVDALKGGGNAASVRLRLVALGVGPSLTIVSERLLETFTDSERAAFEWRPVEGASPRWAFFELVPHTPTTPYVRLAGPGLVAERCATCGFTWGPYYQEWFGPDSGVSEADLPHPARTLVAVDQSPHAKLAVTEARWRDLVGQPSLKGVKGSPIPIIAADAVGHPTFIPRPRAKRAW